MVESFVVYHVVVWSGVLVVPEEYSLINDGCLRIALTGFDKQQHTTIVEHIKERLDFLFTLTKQDEIIKTKLQFVHERK